jgi:Zn-dependent protease/CBS domain-containing protein
LRIATAFGIGIYVHVTLVFFMVWIAVGSAMATGDPLRAGQGLLLMILLFTCVVLHELGHALTARRYGIRTLDIILLPIGGVARLERMPEKPAQEIVVALAGPAVNVVIATLLYLLLAAIGGLPTRIPSLASEDSLLGFVLSVNVLMVLFNLIPAFPMDGGRVLRALLAFKLPYVRATEVAATVGQGIALLFGIVGLFWNPMLLFIALFVFLAASEEWAVVQTRSSLAGLPVGSVMISRFHALSPQDALQRAVDLLMAGHQQDFPVLDGDRVVGVLTRADLLMGLGGQGPSATVGSVMRSEANVASPQDELENAVRRMQESGLSTLPVVSNGRLVGLLTSENVAEFLMVKNALAKRGATA